MIMNVVGIFVDRAAIAALARALESSGAGVARLTVISGSRSVDDLVSAGERVLARDDAGNEDQILTSIRFIVPGLGARQPTEYYSSATFEALSEFGVPDGHTDAYAVAVDGGNCVAGFHDAREDAHKIKMLFAKSGGSRVEVF